MSALIRDEIEEYVNGFYRPLTEELRALRAYGDGNHLGLIMKDSESFLLTLLESERPLRILEIGTSIGYSSAVFATALPEARVDTIEHDPERADAAEANHIRMRLADRIKIHRGDACAVLSGMSEEARSGKREKYDFIFIDAAKSHYREFWDCSARLIRSGGIIACDNLLFKGKTVYEPFIPGHKHRTSVVKLREFIAYISAWDGAETRIFAIGDGISVSRIR